MPLEREMLPDPPEAREKLVCAFQIAKAAHAALAFARRLLAVLCAVVHADRDMQSFTQPEYQQTLLESIVCRRVAAKTPAPSKQLKLLHIRLHAVDKCWITAAADLRPQIHAATWQGRLDAIDVDVHRARDDLHHDDIASQVFGAVDHCIVAWPD